MNILFIIKVEFLQLYQMVKYVPRIVILTIVPRMVTKF